jgi:hypothetical protein
VSRKRLLGLALVFALGHSAPALAGENLLASATRLVREAGSEAALRASPSRRVGVFAQAGPGVVSTSGLRKRTKLMIVVGAAAAFAGTAYAIDHRVRDVTPSSLGTRAD